MHAILGGLVNSFLIYVAVVCTIHAPANRALKRAVRLRRGAAKAHDNRADQNKKVANNNGDARVDRARRARGVICEANASAQTRVKTKSEP